MKKVLTVAAAAGLMMLGACQPAAENTTVEDTMNSFDANAEIYTNEANMMDEELGNMTDMNVTDMNAM
ncbi:hypothetical protein [Stakelama tenebrarum]|uniref:Circumsporozoite protein n=1 Tax=Stakelama tenebrarum TaxID=2711215 RepID=A0A6G6Y5L0_9SPHN|nr:hypothetical protein [Sphingosinithalassobacter tenebrarum]QIG80008.1 hypothetical protein G5C33_09610 [Sphingosinithalassobacter tenebrarum]